MDKALFYLSNHSDNICSVKFFGENNLLSSCNCGLVTLWDLRNIKSVHNYKVSNYSAFYSDIFDNNNFFVKTKEGSLKIWNIKHDTCVIKFDVNNFTYAKPYSINNKLVTPINHDGDVAIYDINMKQNVSFDKNTFIDQINYSKNILINNRAQVNENGTILSNNISDNKNNSKINNHISTYNKNSTHNKLVLSFKEVKKKISNIEILCNKENKEHKKFKSNNLNMCKEIIDIYPLTYFGETFILVCYEPSLFFIYDFRMTSDFISSFMIDANKNVLSYNVNNNNCIISTNNNFVYYLTFGRNQKAHLEKIIHNEHNMNNIVIRSDDQIFLSISNNSTINICDLHNMKLIDHISSYKFNYFNFLDFHNLSGFFAAAENSKISIWNNHAHNFNSIKNS